MAKNLLIIEQGDGSYAGYDACDNEVPKQVFDTRRIDEMFMFIKYYTRKGYSVGCVSIDKHNEPDNKEEK